MRYSEHMCPRFQYALALLSKRWTGLIVKALLDGPARFNELAERLQVVADRVLAERLRELETEGIVLRQVSACMPVRVAYSLTTKGRDLTPVIEAIETWSHQWIDPSTVGATADDETAIKA
ncbi:MAG: helix-turn-helix domain-containing protein [Ktedonobacterales bacterium]